MTSWRLGAVSWTTFLSWNLSNSHSAILCSSCTPLAPRGLLNAWSTPLGWETHRLPLAQSHSYWLLCLCVCWCGTNTICHTHNHTHTNTSDHFNKWLERSWEDSSMVLLYSCIWSCNCYIMLKKKGCKRCTLTCKTKQLYVAIRWSFITLWTHKLVPFVCRALLHGHILHIVYYSAFTPV